MTQEIKEGSLRVWNVINPPNEPRYYPVETPLEGKKKIDEVANRQLKNKHIHSNAFGLEVYEDGQWNEWYNDEGQDVDEAFEDQD